MSSLPDPGGAPATAPPPLATGGPAGLCDPLPLSRALIACPSVTPTDAGALDRLQQALETLGFACTRLPFGGGDDGTARVDNLYARLDGARPGPVFGFAGHVDVVPVGEGWSLDPFAAEVREGHLYGRGAADMKTAIACFVAALARLLTGDSGRGGLAGSVALLITGDEEGPAINGTRRVLDWMAETGERMDLCLVGEPTCPTTLGEMIKIGRRGSLNATLTLTGKQGHTAYPQFADNPLHRLRRLLDRLLAEPLDTGTAHFDPSTVQITSIDTGNPATNVIPATVAVALNIRFNDAWTAEALEAWLREACRAACAGEDAEAAFSLAVEVSGESFVTPPGPLSDHLSAACAAVTGRHPVLSTSGGTSDARFIKDHCPVAECGLVGRTAHKADEHVALSDLEGLTEIYRRTLAGVLGLSC